MAKNRCSNSDARRFVEYRDTFETNNKTMFGEWHGGVYAVYSYGYHFPMYVWDAQAHVWVGNKDKYSRTTSVHQTKARPSHVTHWMSTEQCREVISHGLVGVVAKRME